MKTTLIKLAAVLAVLLALFFVFKYIDGLGYARAKAEDKAAIEQQKREATEQLASETAKVQRIEKALQEAQNQQELQDAQNQNTINDLSARLRNSAGPAGRLRDPNAPGCRQGSGGTASPTAPAPNASPDNTTQASGLLSAQLTELLQQLTREADDINLAYVSCRADAVAIRATAFQAL